MSLIKCISLTERLLLPWIIFKGKQQQKAWFQALKSGHIALSENGWTDNELGLEWIQQCFEPNTRSTHSEGGWRLLVLDGHASHVTLKLLSSV